MKNQGLFVVVVVVLLFFFFDEPRVLRFVKGKESNRIDLEHKYHLHGMAWPLM